MVDYNPFLEKEAEISRENELVAKAQGGDQAALEGLIRLHRPWLFNIILHMTGDFEDAEDLCQETVIKCFTRLSTFRGRSRFRTWLYRIAVNHVISCKRRPTETATKKSVKTLKHDNLTESFLSREWPDPKVVPSDVALLAAEVKIKCMLGMLTCLNRKQRMVFVLGSIFRVDSRIGSELLRMSGPAFRKILSRARKKVDTFIAERCGLLNPAKPCRCERVVPAGLANGFLDPARLRSRPKQAKKIREIAVAAQNELEDIVGSRSGELYRDHPFHEPADVSEKLFRMLESARFLNL